MRAWPLSLLLLSACAVGAEYAPPNVNLPALWQSLTEADDSRVQRAEPDEARTTHAWWSAFHDGTLNDLVARGEAGNIDIKIAAARVQEARALRTIASAARLPEINADASASRGNRGNMFNEKPIGLYEAAFDARWEIDVFGRAARLEEAAEADIAAREADAEAVRRSLRAEVARVYAELRGAEQERTLTEHTARTQAETLKLTQSLASAGIVRGSDVALATAQLHATEASLPALRARMAAGRQQLAVLLGITAEKLPPSLNEIAMVPALSSAVVVATPADVIASRPDVKVAERALASATALSAAAIANQYPRLSLSGAFGLRHSSLAGAGDVWSMGGEVLQPIFNAGRIRAGIEQADARQEQALLAYEQAVLAAMAEVETALSDYLRADETRLSLEKAASAAGEAALAAQLRYRRGIAPYQDVLEAERTHVAQSLALAQSRTRTATAAIRLYKALGE